MFCFFIDFLLMVSSPLSRTKFLIKGMMVQVESGHSLLIYVSSITFTYKSNNVKQAWLNTSKNPTYACDSNNFRTASHTKIYTLNIENHALDYIVHQRD